MEDFQKKVRYYTWGYPSGIFRFFWRFHFFCPCRCFVSRMIMPVSVAQGPWHKEATEMPPCAIMPRRRKKLLCSGVLLPTRQRNTAYWQKTAPRRQGMMPPTQIWLPTRPNPNKGFCTWPIVPCRWFFQENAQMPHEFGAS